MEQQQIIDGEQDGRDRRPYRVGALQVVRASSRVSIVPGGVTPDGMLALSWRKALYESFSKSSLRTTALLCSSSRAP